MPFRRTDDARPDQDLAVAATSRHRAAVLALPESEPSEASDASVEASDDPAGAAAADAVLDAPDPANAQTARSLVSRVIAADVDDRAACVAADGDDSVATQLRELDPRWHSLHAVRPGERGEDVDDVVIGPGGVFTINAKDLTGTTVWVSGGTFVVDGERTPFVRNNRSAARRTAGLLSAATGVDVEVDAIISVGGAQDGFVVAAQPEHGQVHVIARMRLASFLASRPEVLGADDIERIFAAGRRLATWTAAVERKVLLARR